MIAIRKSSSRNKISEDKKKEDNSAGAAQAKIVKMQSLQLMLRDMSV